MQVFVDPLPDKEHEQEPDCAAQVSSRCRAMHVGVVRLVRLMWHSEWFKSSGYRCAFLVASGFQDAGSALNNTVLVSSFLCIFVLTCAWPLHASRWRLRAHALVNVYGP